MVHTTHAPITDCGEWRNEEKQMGCESKGTRYTSVLFQHAFICTVAAQWRSAIGEIDFEVLYLRSDSAGGPRSVKFSKYKFIRPDG